MEALKHIYSEAQEERITFYFLIRNTPNSKGFGGNVKSGRKGHGACS